jgi:hypothetical protein
METQMIIPLAACIAVAISIIILFRGDEND